MLQDFLRFAGTTARTLSTGGPASSGRTNRSATGLRNKQSVGFIWKF